MKIAKFAPLILLVGGSGCASAAPDCRDAVSTFLTTPSAKTSEALAETAPDQCWAFLVADDLNFHRLTSSVAGGNDAAAELLAKHIESTDGGSAEDALIALGAYSEKRLERFFQLVRSNKLPESIAADSMASTPESLVDQLDQQIALLSVRRSQVSKITVDTGLQTKLLQALDAAILARKEN